ncbi:hypothetical protein [uncultured Rubinisphaera sp.]|uniref:hypothetical protein n=1 Tax=uncultured Rubinisphaera sp. TaxID=1678686 RepID=UPI0030DCAEE2
MWTDIGLDETIQPLLIFLGIAASYFLLVPLLVLATFKAKAHPTVVMFDAASQQMPESIVDYYKQMNEELIEIGFQPEGAAILPDAFDNVRVLLTMYINEAEGTSAMLNIIWGFAGDAPVEQQKYLEFMTEISGQEIRGLCTNNNPIPGAFADKEDEPQFRFPHIQSVARLHRCHQELVQRHCLEARRTFTLREKYQGDFKRFIAESVLKEDYEREVRRGTLRYDAPSDTFQATFFGAYPITWRSTFPLKHFLAISYKLKGRRLEGELV